MTHGLEVRRLVVTQFHHTARGRANTITIARWFNIGVSTLCKWYKKVRSGEQLAPLGTRRQQEQGIGMDPVHFEFLLEYITNYPVALICEMRRHLQQQVGILSSCYCIKRSSRRHNIDRKFCEYAAKEQSKSLRRLYRNFMNMFSPEQLVFIDESHTKPTDGRRNLTVQVAIIKSLRLTSVISSPSPSLPVVEMVSCSVVISTKWSSRIWWARLKGRLDVANFLGIQEGQLRDNNSNNLRSDFSVHIRIDLLDLNLSKWA